jgi:cellulose synthase/poly-beta-1,6-N-acetylglucosamine synthase-like glycosyltransferase
MYILRKGYTSFYAENSYVYNFPAIKFSDYLTQRRRIFCGHLNLIKKEDYKITTTDNFKVLKCLIKLKKPFIHKIFAIVIEGIARILGYIDYLQGKEDVIWKRIKPYQN